MGKTNRREGRKSEKKTERERSERRELTSLVLRESERVLLEDVGESLILILTAEGRVAILNVSGEIEKEKTGRKEEGRRWKKEERR